MAIITIGETTILANDGSTTFNVVYAYGPYTLAQTATIESVSIYLASGAGINIRLGIYDATGPSGGPGVLKAQTVSFGIGAVPGWTSGNVITPVSLAVASYWIGFVSDMNLNIKYVISGATGKNAPSTFGPMPGTFPGSPSSDSAHYSLYATLDTSVGILISGGAPRMAGWAYT